MRCGERGGPGGIARGLVPAVALLLTWVSALAGCGGDEARRPLLSVGVGASWSASPATPQDLGYVVTVLFLEVPPPGTSSCSPVPDSTRLSVNGQQLVTVLDDTGCVNTPVALGPSWQVGRITVEVNEGDQVVSHGEFENLAPGGGATLAMPADGVVQSGDEIVVVPTPELPTGMLAQSFARFYPLDDAGAWRPSGVLSPGEATRLADGIHVRVPAFVGRTAVVFAGMPYVPDPTFSCTGFAVCTAIADNTLGPVFVTGVP